jgi:hypothetical protein
MTIPVRALTASLAGVLVLILDVAASAQAPPQRRTPQHTPDTGVEAPAQKAPDD